MTAFTNYLENKILDHVFRNTAYTPPAAVYVGLFTAAPGEAGGGTEVSGGSYARELLGAGAAASGVIGNGSDIEFATATADWGTVTHIGVFDAVSGGNLLAYAELTQAKVIAEDDTLRLLTGNLTIAVD